MFNVLFIVFPQTLSPPARVPIPSNPTPRPPASSRSPPQARTRWRPAARRPPERRRGARAPAPVPRPAWTTPRTTSRSPWTRRRSAEASFWTSPGTAPAAPPRTARAAPGRACCDAPGTPPQHQGRFLPTVVSYHLVRMGHTRGNANTDETRSHDLMNENRLTVDLLNHCQIQTSSCERNVSVLFFFVFFLYE